MILWWRSTNFEHVNLSVKQQVHGKWANFHFSGYLSILLCIRVACGVWKKMNMFTFYSKSINKNFWTRNPDMCRRKTQGASSILCTEKQFCGVFSNREISKKVRIVNIFGNTMTRDVWLPGPNILNTKISNVQNILGFLMEMCQGSC